MQSLNCQFLYSALVNHSNNPSIKNIHDKLINLTSASPIPDVNKFIKLYKDAIPLIEDELWRSELTSHQIELYQNIFKEMEALIDDQKDDKRFKFIVVIPVADRPQHLQACLDSLLQLCKAYNYGGFDNGKFNKLAVIIADDSKYPESISKHKEIAHQFTYNGLDTEYFGIEQQLAQIDALDVNIKHKLYAVLGNIDRNCFYHKGPSIMRNITYLKLNDIARADNKVLFFFIDSDQEFRVKASTKNGEKEIYTINYFYYLNEIFSTTNAQILTGKVVGDPPVSPSVMTSNFLDDVINFLKQISQLKPGQDCAFHNHPYQDQEGAYHDMASLFGFDTDRANHDYHCPILGKHDHRESFSQFSRVINHFFYGEHPTRSTYYHHENIISNTKSARTIYTGNYVFRAEALKYFIPFASLKLRMAGPVLGRLIKAEIADRFISANLPLLHKRTVEDTGQSEFRPGIEKQSFIIDLSGEFQRQYFGDVMLFSIEQLTARGFPIQDIPAAEIMQTLVKTDEKINKQYIDKHREIIYKLSSLVSVFTNRNHWWNSSQDIESANVNLNTFINNIEHNFGDHSEGYQLLCSRETRQQHLQIMADSIEQYKNDRRAWEQTLATGDS